MHTIVTLNDNINKNNSQKCKVCDEPSDGNTLGLELCKMHEKLYKESILQKQVININGEIVTI